MQNRACEWCGAGNTYSDSKAVDSSCDGHLDSICTPEAAAKVDGTASGAPRARAEYRGLNNSNKVLRYLIL